MPMILGGSGTISSDKISVDANGNVGIGTSTPSTRLEVNVAGVNGIHLNNPAAVDSPRLLFTGSGGPGTSCVLVSANGDFRFGTGGTVNNSSGTERMRIDSSGRVTMPYQPAFHVSDSVGTGTSASTYIKNTNLTNVVHNIGSNYDTSTCRFTAPVAGKYFFYYGCNISGAQVHDVMIYVNGTGRVRAYANPASSVWTFQMTQAMIYLSINDYIEFYYTGDPDAGLTWHYAGGYLLG
jgi:hypothetical protein